MRIKGLEKFKEKFPDYPGKRIWVFGIIAAFSLVLSITVHYLGFLIPRLVCNTPELEILEPFIPILVSVIITIAGFTQVESIWIRKNKLINKDKERALQHVYPMAVIGIPMIISLIVHNIIPPYLLIELTSNSELTPILSSSLTVLLGLPESLALPIRLALGLLIIILGLRTINRALNTFGMDYMGLVYLYYPKESKVQKYEIYSVLRHPLYFSLILIGLGTIIMHLSFYQVADFICFFTGLNIHLHFFEEKELISRFGDSYINYKESTPWIFPKSFKTYIKFILNIVT